ncbi:MAG: hypothetical protein ACJATE_000680 [Bacteroidia bacterium]
MNKLLQKQDNRNILAIVLLAIVVRLLILPWSQTVHADAVSRVFLALNWLSNPHYITDGYWGPLHHYLNALFLWIFPGWIIGPKLLNIILASLTVAPLYGFTMSLFSNRKGAVFVALIYVFCPIVMRNSFQSLAGISYAFFVVSSMFFLAEGLRKDGNLEYAILAGFAITLAAATRYEAWVIIATFTLVSMLFEQWKFTAVFWIFAMIFPGSWMIGNQIEFGDFLYSVNQNDVWNIEKEGINDNVDAVLLMQRKIFFPLSFIQNVSPITALFILFGLGWAITKRKITRAQLIWLIPFVVMAAIFMQKAYAGTLMMQNRFTQTWVILLLPFTALAFVNPNFTKLKSVLMTIAVVTLMPLSFFWGLPKYQEWFGDGNLAKAMENLALSSAREVESIPLLRSPDTERLVTAINSNKQGGGLVLDFIGWDQTYYAALRAPVRSYITDGAKHGEVDYPRLKDYLSKNPEGLIVIGRFGRLNQSMTIYSSAIGWKAINKWLSFELLLETKGEKLFTYHVLDSLETNLLEFDSISNPLFSQDRNAAFFEQIIRSDLSWNSKVKRSSFWNGEPLDTTLAKNARYMVGLEN